jgi:hypothetical protein
MVRRIKPVVRILEINTRVSRIRREALVGTKPLFQLGDQWFPAVVIFE